MDVLLVMFKANGKRHDFPLSKPTTVLGRGHGCGLRIPLSSVSREHCQVEVRNDGVWLSDLGSSNGTFYNGDRVVESKLDAGDTIMIGPVHFTVVIDGDPSSVEPVATVLEDGGDAGVTAAAEESSGLDIADSGLLGPAEVGEDSGVELLGDDSGIDFDEAPAPAPAAAPAAAASADDSGGLQFLDDDAEDSGELSGLQLDDDDEPAPAPAAKAAAPEASDAISDDDLADLIADDGSDDSGELSGLQLDDDEPAPTPDVSAEAEASDMVPIDELEELGAVNTEESGTAETVALDPEETGGMMIDFPDSLLPISLKSLSSEMNLGQNSEFANRFMLMRSAMSSRCPIEKETSMAKGSSEEFPTTM